MIMNMIASTCYSIYEIVCVCVCVRACVCVLRYCADMADDESMFEDRVFRGSIVESAAGGDEVLLNIPLSLASRRGLVGGMYGDVVFTWREAPLLKVQQSFGLYRLGAHLPLISLVGSLSYEPVRSTVRGTTNSVTRRASATLGLSSQLQKIADFLLLPVLCRMLGGRVYMCVWAACADCTRNRSGWHLKPGSCW